MLFERLVQAKKNLGIEEKLLTNPENENVESEEVIIGQDYIDSTWEAPSEVFEDPHKEILVANNGLEGDEDVCDKETNDPAEFDKEFVTTKTVTPEFLENNSTLSNTAPVFSDPDITNLKTPTLEQKEESMILCTDPYRKEDTSGVTHSNVVDFLEKYAEGNDIIQVLRKDLMSVLSDVQWIKESNNQHEQFAMDFCDALNELSVSI